MDTVDVLNKVTGKLESWVNQFIAMLPNIAAAIVIILVFGIAAKLVKKFSGKILGKFSNHVAVNNLITSMLYLATLIVGLFVALGVLQLEKTVTSLLAGAGIIGLALGFAFQDTATNFMSGVFIAVRKPFTEGDILETNDFMGTVMRINLRTTLLRTFQGQVVHIPNKEIFQNPMVNYTHDNLRRVDLAVGVSYGDDLEKAKNITIEAVKSLDSFKKDKGVTLFYDSFGNSSINFNVRFWVDFYKQADYLRGKSDAIMAIKKAYDENDITIPFPIRTLDFGIKGGEKFSEQMREVNGSNQA